LLSEIYSTNAQVNVTQFHNHNSRDGLYIDSAFTQGAAANLARDLNFNGRISGNVYAQPLYIDNGPGGRPTIIAVTESNNVYALDAVDGSVIWQRNVGGPVFRYDLTCPGIIDQYGITGTPIVDLASRALFFNAMITPDGGITKKHLVFSLNIDTGDINPGWPLDVGEVAIFNGTTFTPSQQAQRPALGIVDNILYVPYGGLLDCSPYHGWLVGVPINNPAGAMAWATSAIGGSVWGVGGVASDGTNPFITTGNTFNTGGNWMGGEAVIRFQPGPIFTGATDDYWAPLNWLTLDNNDQDLGSSGPLLVDVPGATPSALVVAMGKDGNTYLLDRIHLGGISPPVASSNLGLGNTHEITQAAATYRTNQGTYVALRASSGMLSAFRITTTNPPDIDYLSGWSVTRNGCGSPFVTSTDGTNNTIVWVVGTNPGPGGSNGDHRLNGYDGDTGAVIYGGGGPNELMPGTHSFSTTGIAARGRIYVATDSKVYAFIVPGGTPTPTPTPTPTATATPKPTATPTPTLTVQVTVRTNPAGLAFTVDGDTHGSTQRFSWASGSTHTIGTTSPQKGGTGVRHVWMNWSDSGAISHAVAPTANKTYTATFKTQYHLTMTHETGGTVSPMSGWKNRGTAISISAMPASDFSFTNWTGSGTGSFSGTNNPASITMGGPITETATFTHN